MKIVFINYYPQNGKTADNAHKHSIELILQPFVEQLRKINIEIEEVNLDSLNINPCEGCTQDINFVPTPGCEHINDDMNSLYPVLRNSEIWVFAISMNNKSIPKKVNNFIDRLEPLFNSSDLSFENALTQLTFDQSKGKVFLFATSEHWSKEVFHELSNQIQSVSLLFAKKYFGEVLRSHFGVFATKLEQDEDFRNTMIFNLTLLAKDLISSDSISNGYLEELSEDIITKVEFDTEIEKILEKVI
jgi:multimeric flavodoxin WrbA